MTKIPLSRKRKKKPFERTTYGPWKPTPYLRWYELSEEPQERMLQQRMRRRVKNHPQGMRAYAYYEYRWMEVPTESVET